MALNSTCWNLPWNCLAGIVCLIKILKLVTGVREVKEFCVGVSSRKAKDWEALMRVQGKSPVIQRSVDLGGQEWEGSSLVSWRGGGKCENAEKKTQNSWKYNNCERETAVCQLWWSWSQYLKQSWWKIEAAAPTKPKHPYGNIIEISHFITFSRFLISFDSNNFMLCILSCLIEV